jgi:diguanylate cyclase (GGDEF)-like protein
MFTGKQNSRHKIRRFFALILALILFISGLSFYSTWNFTVRERHEHMQRDGGTVSLMINDSLDRARELLKINQTNILQKLVQGSEITPPSGIEEILNSSRREFGLHNSDDQFSSLLLLDATGHLIAQSGQDTHSWPDLSDQYYFTNLRNDPTKEFTIGPLLTARTTGPPFFHAAIPLRDPTRGLVGVLALQINASRLENQVQQILPAPNEQIVVRMLEGHVLFKYPLSPLPANKTQSRALDSYRVTTPDRTEDAITLPRDPFGLSTTILFPKRKILEWYCQHNAIIFLLTLVTIGLVVLFFRGLCKQAVNLQKSVLEATTDFNTGLRNRRALEDELPRLISHAHRNHSPLSLLFIDIDHFKTFNDLHGHDLGDKVLRHVALCMTDFSRRPLDYCCRWGGEEFVVVLPDTGAEDGMKMAAELMECVGKIRIDQPSGTDIKPITISVGVATTEKFPDATPEELIARADQAMLQAKKEGRNRAVML